MERLPYGNHPHQFADLYRAEMRSDSARPTFAAVVVHGGFWTTANGSLDRMASLCEDLNRRGWAAFNVEYRRLGDGRGGGWPQTAQDVSAAIDHLATVLGPEVIVSVGHSAGAHLTLLDAAREDTRVIGTVGQAPLTDVAFAHALGGEAAQVVEAFMGGPPPGAYADASPLHRLPLDIPQLIVQAADDPVVPVAMVDAYVEAARTAGDDVEYTRLPEGGHFDHLELGTPAWAAVTSWLGDWASAI